MVSTLFRDDARASASRPGSIVLTKSITRTAFTVWFGAVAVCIVAFLFEFSVTRKTNVFGVLLPREGLIRIQSPQAGTVTEVLVKEGRKVTVGDVLFVISSDRSSIAQDSAGTATSRLIDSRLQSMQRDQEQQHTQSSAHRAAFQERAQDLTREVGRIEQQIVLQARRITLASDAVKRDQQLLAANFISAASLQQHEADLLDQQQRLADLDRSKAATARDLASVHAEIVNTQIQAARDQEGGARAQAELQQQLAENEVRREVQIRAAQDGTVSAVVAVAGSPISPGQALASLLPANSPLEAEIYASSRAVGFIEPGMKVLLRYQAFPYQKFGQFPGQVREVSATPINGGEISTSTTQPGNLEPVYRIRVSLESQAAHVYGKDRRLKPGMALEASILLEQRRLYEWMLEPLYSIHGRG